MSDSNFEITIDLFWNLISCTSTMSFNALFSDSSHIVKVSISVFSISNIIIREIIFFLDMIGFISKYFFIVSCLISSWSIDGFDTIFQWVVRSWGKIYYRDDEWYSNQNIWKWFMITKKLKYDSLDKIIYSLSVRWWHHYYSRLYVQSSFPYSHMIYITRLKTKFKKKDFDSFRS